MTLSAAFGRIGANVEVNPGELISGGIDEVSIYDKKLTDREVEQNFAADAAFAVNPVGQLALTWGAIKGSR